MLDGPDQFGMVDVLRDVNGSGETDGLTRFSRTRQLDHLFASKELNPVDCHWIPDELDHSDHGPLVATFDV